MKKHLILILALTASSNLYTAEMPTIYIKSVDSSLTPLKVSPQESLPIEQASIEHFIATIVPDYQEQGIETAIATLPELSKKRLTRFITAAIQLDREQTTHAAEGMSEAAQKEWWYMERLFCREKAAIKSLLINFADSQDIRAQTRPCIDRAYAAIDSFFDHRATSNQVYIRTMQLPGDVPPPVEHPDFDLVPQVRAENHYYQGTHACKPSSTLSTTPEKNELPSSKSAKIGDEPSVVNSATMNTFLRALSPQFAAIDLDQLPASTSKTILMHKLSLAITLDQKFAQVKAIRMKNPMARVDKKEWITWNKAVLKEKNECAQAAFFVVTSARYDAIVAKRMDILDQIAAYQLSLGNDTENNVIDNNQESTELRALLEARLVIDKELECVMLTLCSIATAQEETAKKNRAPQKLFLN